MSSDFLVRRHHGPLRPTSVQRQRISLRQRIVALRHEGAADYVWWNPEHEPLLLETAHDALETARSNWFQDEDADLFHNMMFAALF